MKSIEELDAEFDAACQALRHAEARMKRNRTEANRRKLIEAGELHQAAAEACRAARDAAERAETVARRMALTEARRAARALQLNLF